MSEPRNIAGDWYLYDTNAYVYLTHKCALADERGGAGGHRVINYETRACAACKTTVPREVLDVALLADAKFREVY